VILDIKGVSASWTDNKLHLALDVVPEDRAHLDLKTGEIFQDGDYATLRKQEDKAISATLFIARREHNAAGAELRSEMRYIPGSGERESEIRLVWRLPDDHLAGFHSLVLAGRTPRNAVVSLPHSELEFGWEPDGSGQKWDNEKNPSIPIENISFNFELHVPSTDRPLNTEVPEGDDRAFFSDVALINFALLRRLSSIEAALGRLSWTAALIALLLASLAISHFWH
jgi:hypothetical protein